MVGHGVGNLLTVEWAEDRSVSSSHEFVVNLVDESFVDARNRCAASLPLGKSQLIRAGLHAIPSSVVEPPRIAESPASLRMCGMGHTANRWHSHYK